MRRHTQVKEAAAQWRVARQLYPVYAALVRQFDLGIEPSRDLEDPADRSEPEVLERVWKWFDDVDDRVQVFQLRQLMQFSPLATEQNLHLLIDRHLGKASRSEADRDKVDFLLVQYFAHCVSPELSEHNTAFAGVAEVLKPVLGDVFGPAPDALKPLEHALEVLRWCRSLSDVLENGVLEHGRRIKAAIGEKYFEPQALVEFVRFNFFLRRAFFRLLQSDLHALRRTLDELEKKGHTLVDCSPAGLSREESLTALRQKCLEWKKPFQACYSAGPLPFEEIVAVRAALERALTQPPAAPLQARVETQFIASPAAPESQAIQAAPVAHEPAIATSTIEISAPTPAAHVVEAKSKSPAPQPAPKVVDVQSCLENIAEQLFAGAGKAAAGATATTVIVGGARVVLSSWEVEAFVRGGDEVCDTLQRAVSARAVLSEAVESRKRGSDSEGLPSTISLAQTEAAQAQLQIEAAKKARNLDAAVNLAATAKRLLALITEAQGLAAMTPVAEMAR